MTEFLGIFSLRPQRNNMWYYDFSQSFTVNLKLKEVYNLIRFRDLVNYRAKTWIDTNSHNIMLNPSIINILSSTCHDAQSLGQNCFPRFLKGLVPPKTMNFCETDDGVISLPFLLDHDHPDALKSLLTMCCFYVQAAEVIIL